MICTKSGWAPLLKILSHMGIKYKAFDVSELAIIFMKKSVDIAKSLKDDFQKEGNAYLFEEACPEDDELQQFLNGEKKRFLFHLFF